MISQFLILNYYLILISITNGTNKQLDVKELFVYCSDQFY